MIESLRRMFVLNILASESSYRTLPKKYDADLSKTAQTPLRPPSRLDIVRWGIQCPRVENRKTELVQCSRE